ncbi:gliding motility lipoprotein GldB [Flammeovirgaceae bacterium SG7u.111]|nr:gliding motility lipoprotein GldB [Flammeovirgaceae bacterium SG7u.132]WPO35392.1 gliding motility lipoprotein GldB [Flammeovirgaceae bacterium SG7u.111]
MFNSLKYFVIIACSLALYSCENSEEKVPDISNIPRPKIEIERVEDLFKSKDKFQIAEYLDQHPELAKQFFKIDNYPDDSVLVNMIYNFSIDPHTDTLINDVERIFPSTESLEKELEQAFTYIKYYFPDFNVPKIYTSVSGFGSFGFGADLFYSESMIVIGLDWYAGQKSTYRPQDIPDYMLRRYEPEYIVPNIITYVSAKYNSYDFEDRTLLADMIYYGKAYHFTKKMLPYTADTLIIGYTQNEWDLSEQFIDIIWGHFIEENIFYVTSESQKALYIGERPNIPQIADKCPGRVGRWIGWEVAREFSRRKEETSLPELMSIKDARRIFQESRYKPQ